MGVWWGVNLRVQLSSRPGVGFGMGSVWLSTVCAAEACSAPHHLDVSRRRAWGCPPADAHADQPAVLAEVRPALYRWLQVAAGATE